MDAQTRVLVLALAMSCACNASEAEREPEARGEAQAEAKPDAPKAPSQTPGSTEPAAPAPAPVVGVHEVDSTHDVVIGFDAEQPGIYLSVELEGADGRRKRFDYLFDSGASYTTITTQTARELGIEVPPDAPRLEFHTAGGMQSSPVVHLPALIVEDVRISGLLVSICDACATSKTAGLLGLNVIREFVVQTDYQASQMRLLPRVYEQRPNRAYDIAPVLALDVEGAAQIIDGEVAWTLTLTNEGTQAVEGAVPRVDFSNGKQLLGASIARLEPGAVGRSAVAGRIVADEEGGALDYTLALSEAYW